MDTYADANIIASAPGRLRIAIAGLHRNPALKARLESRLALHDAVTEVLASVLTGRVLVRYRPGTARELLLRELGIVIAAPPARIDSGPGRDPRARPGAGPGPAGADPDADRGPAAPVSASQTPASRAPDPTPAAAGARAACYPPWHLRPADEALSFYASSATAGLSGAEAARRLRAGPNRVALPRGRSATDILLAQFKGVPVALLGASATLSLLTGALAEALAIGAVLVINAVIGYGTERRAEATITSLAELVDDRAMVLRDGVPAGIDVAAVVPGDILLLAPGTRIAADVRLLQAAGLKVDESALTGESLPVDKQVAPLAVPAKGPPAASTEVSAAALPDALSDVSPDASGAASTDASAAASREPAVALAERSNMAYRGTAVAAGAGRGLVVGTGNRTEAGAIDVLTRSTGRRRTPLELQLDHLGNQLLAVSSLMCLGVVAAGLLRGHPRGALLRSAIALAVAAVPEGLPATATTSLAKGLRRMRARQVLMRHLYAVETIGTVSTLCLDKTGTLTENRMSAVEVCTLGRRHAAGADGRLEGIAAPGRAGALERLLQVCVLCNEAQANGGAPDAPAQPSATEAALLDLARGGGIDAPALRARFPLLHGSLRAQGRNYMRTVHATPDPARRLVAVKGSPEEVLGLCAAVLDGDHTRPCDDAARQTILRQNQAMAGAQLRVLGFACADIAAGNAAGAASEAAFGTASGTVADAGGFDAASDAAADAGGFDAASDTAAVAGGVDAAPLTWLGLAGLADPLRPGARDVIERFHQAGIRTAMLTGDQAGTAWEIGKALHLNNGGDLRLIHADELGRMAPARLSEEAGRAHVFSRVTPADKLRIVQAIQGAGEVVAMTGDGINDSPALRAADVGIAMGSGTEVALSVADVALKHDRLDTLLDAVAQGRTISDNIRKSVHFLVSSNLSEILVVFGAVAFGRGAPMSPLQLLWLNLLTDLLPAIALGEEPAERDVLQRPPRDPRAALIGRQDMLRYAREALWLAAGTLSAHAYGVLRHGSGVRAATIGFDALVLGQLLHAVFCRSERQGAFSRGVPRNPRMSAALAISAALQGLAHLVPGLRRMLGLSGLGPLDVLAVLAGAGLPLLANEMGRGQNRAATSAMAERSTRRSTTAPASLSATPLSGGRTDPVAP